MSEFHRLVRRSKWERGGDEFKKAREGINTAGVKQFNAFFWNERRGPCFVAYAF
jgi:hypothetical protein